jgi:hypothetical protein
MKLSGVAKQSTKPKEELARRPKGEEGKTQARLVEGWRRG